MNYCFIVNPRSGASEKTRTLAELIRKRFGAVPDHTYRICYTERPGHAADIVSESIKSGVEIIVAVGGDGTMNEVAGHLVHTEAALGILPAGSGNGFARSMNIPLDMKKAIDDLISPTIKRIDVGTIDSRYFFGVAGVGFDARIGARFQEFGVRGPVPYFYIGVKEFFRFDYPFYHLSANGRTWETRPLLIAFANTYQYGIGAAIAPGADAQDGLLEICTLHKMPVHEIVRKLHLLFNGKIARLKAYSRFQTTQLTIRSEDGPILYHTDGEPCQGGMELNVGILPKALKVCCNL